MDINTQHSKPFQTTAYENMPSRSLTSATEYNLIVTFTSTPHERTQQPNTVDNNNNPMSTGVVQSSNANPSPSPTLIPSAYTYDATSSKMSGGAKNGLVVGLTVGLVLLGLLLLAFLILRRKYGPGMWKLLYTRVFTRSRPGEEQGNQEPDPASRGHETHQNCSGKSMGVPEEAIYF
ncbi:uncharacterized protein TRUGW13939_11322 [Talaromyces rugulosus]|uniref:Uncharacterized protein n=1 Tax=Talaromyces rugulosus TaxID=121627 RepID=A0A7H8RCJ8_TALRU|nr:uncharacterized protein TRUGW13939_11322 [Talaromyces rugulosus]QKX64149.1 hypothetical protein TRUGW13939_11322 [Talaromyces rugulosus]